jgi:Fatty acid desaturase
MNDNERTRIIAQGITAASKAVRQRYRWLQYQNAIGLAIFIGCIAAILWAWSNYLPAYIAGEAGWSWWIVVPFCAFFMSVLHELEHDLIHRLYFNKNNFAHRFVHNAMLLGVWLMRPTTANPWLRRAIHIHHHQHSGTAIDIEERSVTNGERWSLLRFIITSDLILAYLLRQPRLHKETKALIKSGAYSPEEVTMLNRATRFGMLPFGVPLHFVWYTYIIYNVCAAFGAPILALTWHIDTWIQPLVVMLIAPNMLRQFCLHFITSNIHYFGDVEDGNILQQTQVFDAWWTLPFHLFCCNFGGTHGIHHFVVNEPFYIRQLSAAESHVVMRANGVRFNDLGTFWRANRYGT